MPQLDDARAAVATPDAHTDRPVRPTRRLGGGVGVGVDGGGVGGLGGGAGVTATLWRRWRTTRGCLRFGPVGFLVRGLAGWATGFGVAGVVAAGGWGFVATGRLAAI